MLGPTIAPPVAAYIVGFGFPGQPGFTPLAVVIYDWLGGLFNPSSPGITPDSALNLFYNSKNNEFMSLTVGVHNEASSINATGYFYGRIAEYATMNFLNNTLYPTFPKWEIMNYSGSNLNASMLDGLAMIFDSWMSDYDGALQDTIRYAQTSFIGPLAALDLKLGATSIKASGVNDYEFIYGMEGDIYGSSALTTHTLGDLIVTNNSFNEIVTWCNYAPQITFNVDDVLNNNSTDLASASGFRFYTLTPGVYNFSCDTTGQNGDSWHYALYTNGLVVDNASNLGASYIYSPSLNTTYTPTINFIDTSSNTYTIACNFTNSTQYDPMSIRLSVDSIQNFASALASAFWTTLRNAGYYDISQIPPNMVIPLPDFAFLTNTDLSQLTSQEIAAMYLAYMQALGNFFNSTTYENIINFNVANVTFNNEGVIVNASFMNNAQNITWTSGDLYIQVYQDMTLTLGMNELTSSGLLYNLNDTTCWRYDAGDYLNISHIYVRSGIDGNYTEVTNATITATSIQAYLLSSNSGTGLVPTPSGSVSAGGGGSSILLLLAVGVILIVLLRGKTQQSSGPVVVTRTTPQNTKL